MRAEDVSLLRAIFYRMVLQYMRAEDVSLLHAIFHRMVLDTKMSKHFHMIYTDRNEVHAQAFHMQFLVEKCRKSCETCVL
jgi:hypothetical protein